MSRSPSSPYETLPLKRRRKAIRRWGLKKGWAVKLTEDQVVVFDEERPVRSYDVTTLDHLNKAIRRVPDVFGIDEENLDERIEEMRAIIHKLTPAEPEKPETPEKEKNGLARWFQRYLSYESPWRITTKLGLVGIMPQAIGLLSLSGSEKGILRALWEATSQETLTAKRSWARLAEESGFSRATVARVLPRLEALGLIRTVKPGQTWSGPGTYGVVPPKHWPRERHEEMKAAIRKRLAMEMESQRETASVVGVSQ